ncbi:MAG: PEP-CTERM sorting domain-containing protein [bacterium]|nr:PEP-CTERM sorting domain-containing protein [bacterium]
MHIATGTSVNVYLGPQPQNPTSTMDATFDDSAAGAPPSSGDIIGTFLAADLLAAFNGLELSGQWDLEIIDTTGWANEGIDLVEWRLNGTHVPEPGTGLLLATGLVGLAVLSGRKRDLVE